MDICENWGEGSGLEVWDESCESTQDNDFENYKGEAEHLHSDKFYSNSDNEKFLSFDTTVNIIVLMITLVVLVSIIAALCR